MDDQALQSPRSEVASPNFDLGIELNFDSDDFFDLTGTWDWDSDTDDVQLLECLYAIENENSTNATTPVTTSSTGSKAPGANDAGELTEEPPAVCPLPAKKTRRHAALKESDLTALERDKDEKNTILVTEWAVRTITGKKESWKLNANCITLTQIMRSHDKLS